MLKIRKVSNFVTELPHETFKKGHGHLVRVENIYIHSILQNHEYSMRLWHTRYITNCPQSPFLEACTVPENVALRQDFLGSRCIIYERKVELCF